MYNQFLYDPEAELYERDFEEESRKGGFRVFVTMTDRDIVLLSPWEQFRKYRKIPVEGIVQMILLCLAVTQAVIIASQFDAHDMSNQNTFRKLFLDDEYADGLYSIDDVFSAVNDTVEAYYTIPNRSLTRYAFFRDDDDHIEPMTMRLRSYKKLEGRFWNITQHAPFKSRDYDGDYHRFWADYDLTYENPLGPLQFYADEGYPDENNQFYYLTDIVLKCRYHTADVGSISVLPVDWDISIIFDMRYGGEAQTTIVTQVHPVASDTFETKLQWGFTVTILLVSCVNAVICSLELHNRYRILGSTRNAYEIFSRFSSLNDEFATWEIVPISVKIAFFSYWSVTNLIGSLLLMISQLLLWLILAGGKMEFVNYAVIMGFGITLMCINIMRYLQYNKKFYMFVIIWQYSMANIFRFIVSVFPLYAAYVLFGVLNFSQYSERFATLDQASVSLFSLLNGDDIHDTFNDLVDGQYPYSWIGRIYLYSFVLLSMTSILNVCIFIIEDAYHIAKHCANEQHESDREIRKRRERRVVLKQKSSIRPEGTPLLASPSRDSSINEGSQKSPTRYSSPPLSTQARKSFSNPTFGSKRTTSQKSSRASPESLGYGSMSPPNSPEISDVTDVTGSPDASWCRHCRELPEKKEAAKERASMTSKDKIRVIFDNLEKWQTIAAGPDYPVLALENEIDRRAHFFETDDHKLNGGEIGQDNFQLGNVASDESFDEFEGKERQEEEKKEKKEKKEKREKREKRSSKGDKSKEELKKETLEKFHSSVAEMLRRHEENFKKECEFLRTQFHSAVADLDAI